MNKLAGPVSKGRRAAVILSLAFACCALWARGLGAGEVPKTPPGGLGEELFRFGKEGIGPSQMTRVEYVALDPAGFVYLGDWELGRLQRFSPQGKLEAVAYVQSDRVTSLAYERSGVLFVVTLYHMFRYDAKSLKLLGEVERSEGDEYLAVAARPGGGVIAILESRSAYDEIAFLDKEGKVERILHDSIHKAAGYSVQRPFVTVDGKGFFYVADNGNHAIFRFDTEGRYISRFGYTGHPTGDSSTDFAGITVDGRGQLWVSGWSTLNVVTVDGRPRQSYEMSSYGLAVNDRDELFVSDRTQVRQYAAAKP